MRISEERLRLTMESINDYAIVTLDEAGTIVDWNSGAEQVFGYTAMKPSASPVSLSLPLKIVHAVYLPKKCDRHELQAGPPTSAGMCARMAPASLPAASLPLYRREHTAAT